MRGELPARRGYAVRPDYGVQPMPHLTPALPLRYRRRALAALEGLVTPRQGRRRTASRDRRTPGRGRGADDRRPGQPGLRGEQPRPATGTPAVPSPGPAAARGVTAAGGVVRRPVSFARRSGQAATDLPSVTVRVASARERPDDLEVRHRSPLRMTATT